MSKRNYKATMVFDLRDTEGGADELISHVSEIIRSVDGDVQKVESLGNRNFARPKVRGFGSGTYAQFDFEADGEAPKRLREKLALEKKVDRVIVELA